jgi:hypothetical protein
MIYTVQNIFFMHATFQDIHCSEDTRFWQILCCYKFLIKTLRIFRATCGMTEPINEEILRKYMIKCIDFSRFQSPQSIVQFLLKSNTAYKSLQMRVFVSSVCCRGMKRVKLSKCNFSLVQHCRFHEGKEEISIKPLTISLQFSREHICGEKTHKMGDGKSESN